jgi:hypothetical protein
MKKLYEEMIKTKGGERICLRHIWAVSMGLSLRM